MFLFSGFFYMFLVCLEYIWLVLLPFTFHLNTFKSLLDVCKQQKLEKIMSQVTLGKFLNHTSNSLTCTFLFF